MFIGQEKQFILLNIFISETQKQDTKQTVSHDTWIEFSSVEMRGAEKLFFQQPVRKVKNWNTDLTLY